MNERLMQFGPVGRPAMKGRFGSVEQERAGVPRFAKAGEKNCVGKLYTNCRIDDASPLL